MGGILASVGVVVVAGLAFIGGGFAARPSAPDDPGLFSGSAGVFDVLNQNDPAAEFRVGYRWERRGRVLRPLVAAMVTSDGATYACGGVAYDLALGRRFVMTPSFAPGLYAKGGGFDLGHVVEFRSQIALDYRLPRGARIGLSISHMSNAHLGAKNPGVDALVLNYSRSLR
ncbi:MAG: acyloxyacyl hydrolase [Vicinamibacteria bacterium]|nr:acyloxyacyl hydrolase [Thermoplasmata archaeon]